MVSSDSLLVFCSFLFLYVILSTNSRAYFQLDPQKPQNDITESQSDQNVAFMGACACRLLSHFLWYFQHRNSKCAVLLHLTVSPDRIRPFEVSYPLSRIPANTDWSPVPRWCFTIYTRDCQIVITASWNHQNQLKSPRIVRVFDSLVLGAQEELGGMPGCSGQPMDTSVEL